MWQLPLITTRRHAEARYDYQNVTNGGFLMANLEKLATNYRSEGYSALLAEARVCQDIVLKAISESSLSRNSMYAFIVPEIVSRA